MRVPTRVERVLHFQVMQDFTACLRFKSREIVPRLGSVFKFISEGANSSSEGTSL